MITKKTIIIGGGITGLSAASFIDHDWLLIEGSNELGGYCKTTISGDFVWDYSGHFFHFKNKEIKDYILEYIDCEVLDVKKVSSIFYNNRLIDFPFQHNIHQLDPKEFARCLLDLLYAKKSQQVSFKDFVYSNLGKAISDKFVIPYNEKLYSCDLDKLDKDCMGRFFPSSSLEDILNSISGKKYQSYNNSFIYPKLGAIEFIKSIQKRLNEKNIQLGEMVTRIDINKKMLETTKGIYKFDNLISTIRFDKFLRKCNMPSAAFKSNKVVVFNIGFDANSTTGNHWIYFPGNEVFYRVGFYDNILSSDKMSLYVEIGMGDEPILKQELYKKVLADLKRVGIITSQNVVDYQMLILDPAYCYITKNSTEQYNNWCDTYNKKGIYSIGRYGSWTYCSIEDNIIQAKNVVKNL